MEPNKDQLAQLGSNKSVPVPVNTIKVVFVGPAQSGKSCIVNGYQQSYKPTIGVDFATYTFKIAGQYIKFDLWDISASMTFNNKNQQYCKSGEIVAFVYAANSRENMRECQQLSEKLVKQDKFRFDAKAAIVATKIDLQRQITQQQGRQAAQVLRSNSLLGTQTYFQVSTKQDKNAVQKLCNGFYRIFKDQKIKKIIQITNQYCQTAPYQPIPQTPTVKLQNTSNAAAAAAGAHPKPVGFQRIYKILIMGDDNIGKSAMLSKYTNGQFSMNYMPTIGVDFAIKNIVAHGYNVKLQIWDTAGLKKFRTITSSYVKGCRAMILCFDCTNPQSFHNLNQHIQLVQKHSYNPAQICKFIVATKIDLPRVVSREQGQNFAKSVGYQYMQVSALMNINIEELFMSVSDYLVMNNVV